MKEVRQTRRVKGAKTRSEFEVAKFASDFAIVGVSTMECHEALPLSLQIHLWGSKTLTTDYPVD